MVTYFLFGHNTSAIITMCLVHVETHISYYKIHGNVNNKIEKQNSTHYIIMLLSKSMIIYYFVFMNHKISLCNIFRSCGKILKSFSKTIINSLEMCCFTANSCLTFLF